MYKFSLIVAAGVALTGCWAPPAEPEPVKPAGDTGTPEEEFWLAHQTVVRIQSRLDELRAMGDPHQPLVSQFPEVLELTRALTTAMRAAGKLGCQVGLADPTGPLGRDALYDGMLYSTESAKRVRAAFHLAARHHPDDPRLGEYLYAVLGGTVPRDAGEWMPEALERVLVTSRHPGVLAAARTGLGKLLLTSHDPTKVAAGERLLAEVVRLHPDDQIGRTRAAAWASGLLVEHQRTSSGGVRLPTVRLAP